MMFVAGRRYTSLGIEAMVGEESFCVYESEMVANGRKETFANVVTGEIDLKNQD